MTSLEPGVIDANDVTSQILCEFYSVITSPRRVAVPSSSAKALRLLSTLLAFARHSNPAEPLPLVVQEWTDSFEELTVATP